MYLYFVHNLQTRGHYSCPYFLLFIFLWKHTLHTLHWRCFDVSFLFFLPSFSYSLIFIFPTLVFSLSSFFPFVSVSFFLFMSSLSFSYSFFLSFSHPFLFTPSVFLWLWCLQDLVMPLHFSVSHLIINLSQFQQFVWQVQGLSSA